MREILFKSKRVDNGEWVEGFLFKMKMEGGYTWCIGEEPLSANDYSEILGENKTWFFINHHTLCQYTGLTDKNGCKIWENDVVSYKDKNVGYDAYGVVKFGEYHSGFDGIANHIGFFIEWNCDCLRKDIGFWTENRECGVVGNIFDNPELLEGGVE